MEKITTLFVVLLGLAATCSAVKIETNYLTQMEEGTLFAFWRRDLDYVVDYLKTEVLPTYEYEKSFMTKCKIHKIIFKKVDLHTDNVKLVIDPLQLHINFSQPIGFDFEVQLLWEYDLLYFPVSGTATFKGQTTNFTYTLNITQPYFGKLLDPSLDLTWSITEWSVDSALGSLFDIPNLIRKMFLDAMNGIILDTLVTDMRDDIPLFYEQFYKPTADLITFAGPKVEIEVMRRYRRVYIDVHLLAMVYQEGVDHVKEGEGSDQRLEVVKNEVRNDGYEGSGMLRRYLREFSVFEQIAKKFLMLLSGFTLTNKDLPLEQKMRLDAEAMELIVPGFKAKYGADKNVTVAISGLPNLAVPVLVPLEPQLVQLNGMGFAFNFYVKEGNNPDVLFLSSTLTSSLKLKPYNAWNNATLLLNFEIADVNVNIVSAESKVFTQVKAKDLEFWTRIGMIEFFVGKCRKNMLGDGLKIRDELGALKDAAWALDVAGRTFNTWLYQAKPQPD